MATWLKNLLARAVASKTLWLNSLALAIQLLTYLAGVVPPEAQPWITVALAILNIILRFVTSTPILPPTPDPAETRMAWIRDAIADAMTGDVPAAEAKALAVKVVTETFADLEKPEAA